MIKIGSICLIIFFPFLFIYLKIKPLTAENNPKWNVEISSQEVEKTKELLKQTFHFLGHGSQCFAFVSEDDEYVLKICRSSRYRSYFSSKGKGKKERDFLSYVLAFKEIGDQSKVTFLHLNRTQNLSATLKVVDPLGLLHTFNADETAFYIQKKAIPLPEYLKGLSALESKIVANKLLRLFSNCCEVGLKMLDIYPKNIGVNQGELLWIDPGRIQVKPSLKNKEPQKKALYEFKSLLTPFLDSEFSEILEMELKTEF